MKSKKLNFSTGRLPLNFIILGYAFFAIGVWRVFVFDWRGVVFIIISLFLVFIKSGVLIDVERQLLKQYYGVLFFKTGKWESISQLLGLLIVSSRESRIINVLSVSRRETDLVYKLYLSLPDRRIEIMSGNEKEVTLCAEQLSAALQTTLVDYTDSYTTQ